MNLISNRLIIAPGFYSNEDIKNTLRKFALRYGVRPEFAMLQDIGTYGSQVVSHQDGRLRYGKFKSGLVALELLKPAQNHGCAYWENSIHRVLK